MSRPDVWMPLYIADYLADTRRLTLQQHGAYFILLMEYWRNGPLMDDDSELIAILQTDKKTWDRDLAPAMRRFFKPHQDGLLHQKRIDEELAKALQLSSKRRAAALQKGSKSSANAHANGQQMSSKSGAIAEQLDTHTYLRDRALQSQSQEESQQAARASPLHGLEHVTPAPGTGIPSVNGWDLNGVLDRVLEAANIDPTKWRGTSKPLITWLSDDIEPDTVVEAIKARVGRNGYTIPSSLAYFDNPVRELHGRKPR